MSYRDRHGRYARKTRKTKVGMLAPIFFGALLIGMYSVLIADAHIEPESVVVEQYVVEVPRTVLIEGRPKWTPDRIKKEYEEAAERHGVSFEQMWNTVMCENTQLIPDLQSHHVLNGVREQSFGISQIHLPSWPTVSYEDAIDPAFSAEFMAEKFSEGSAHLWTCYRQIYGR